MSFRSRDDLAQSGEKRTTTAFDFSSAFPVSRAQLSPGRSFESSQVENPRSLRSDASSRANYLSASE